MIVPVRKIEFAGESGRANLAARLAADAKSLRMLRVASAKEVFLGANGKLANRYELTTVGANQYLTAVAKGLPQLVRFLLTPDVGHVTSPGIVYPILAKVINQMALHRQDVLLDCRAVLAEDRQQLDGFVGRSYCLVPNAEVNEQFTLSCDLLRGTPQFYTASIHGRDVTIVHVARKQSITVNDVVFKTGAVIQNSETAGRAIRSACVLIDSVTKTWSADRFYPDTRVMHVKGSKLRERMMQSADNLSAHQFPIEEIEHDLNAAMLLPIISERSMQAIEAFKQKFAARAERMGVSATASEQILSAIPFTSRVTPTVFDAYVRCLTVARATNVQRSLPIRQLAFSLIFRK
jgi:hypothetical protein